MSANEGTALVAPDTAEPMDNETPAAKDLSKLLSDPAAFADALKQGLEMTQETVLELEAPVQRRVRALRKLQLESLSLEADFYRQVHMMEVAFAAKYKHINDKRATIVSGAVEPTEADSDFPLLGGEGSELAKELDAKVSLRQNDSGQGDVKETPKCGKGIAEFWLTVFRNIDVLAEMVQENDEPVLKHMTDLECKLVQEPMGFVLTFHFEPNQFFTNTTLTKEYSLKCVVDPLDPFEFDGPEITDCKGCTIDWKQGKNVTVKLMKKKQKHKAKQQTRFVTKEVKADSFFNFFDPPTIPETGSEGLDEETRELLNADFELGQIMRDRVIPRAVLYFTGELQDDDDDFSDEEDEDEDLDDSEEDEGDDEDQEESSNDPQKKPEECKQQ